MIRLFTGLLVAGSISVLSGQSPATPFEVATLRKNTAKACTGRWDFRTAHGTVTAENAPLLRIIGRAYRLTDDRISGPPWLDSECYDIKAKAACGSDIVTTVRDQLGLRLEQQRGLVDIVKILGIDKLPTRN